MTKNDQTSYIFAKCKGERAHIISQIQSIINSSNRGDSDSALAFALLKVRGSFDAILRKLKTLPNFAEAHVIPGAFDILAAFRADSSEDLLEKSVEKISSINGITASETLISYSLPEKF